MAYLLYNKITPAYISSLGKETRQLCYVLRSTIKASCRLDFFRNWELSVTCSLHFLLSSVPRVSPPFPSVDNAMDKLHLFIYLTQLSGFTLDRLNYTLKAWAGLTLNALLQCDLNYCSVLSSTVSFNHDVCYLHALHSTKHGFSL